MEEISLGMRFDGCNWFLREDFRESIISLAEGGGNGWPTMFCFSGPLDACTLYTHAQHNGIFCTL